MLHMQLCQEIEKKAVLVREQQAEFQRVQLAYAQARAIKWPTLERSDPLLCLCG